MGDIATQIRRAVEALSTNSQNQGRRLRELLDEAPVVFKQVVAAMLGTARDTPELRYVIALLSARGMLVPMLRELVCTDRGAAGVVAQLAQRMDPGFDRSLGRHVSGARPPIEKAQPDPEFLLGLLDSLSDGLCLMPLLAPLRQSEDPRIRARMALLLGRITRAQDWFQALEKDENPRVRSNVIESLWSVGGEASSQCFARGLQDPDHRVVANSLIGLYLQGETAGVSGLVQMAEHQDTLFRAAAAWAMGRTGDTRFLQTLRQMRRGTGQDSMVLRNALHAIARINQATIAATRRETHVTCLRTESFQDSGFDAIVIVHDKESAPLPILKTTDWQLRANQQPVWSYQAQFVPAAATLALGLVLPHAPTENGERSSKWDAALGAAATWRRPHDQFAAALYAESADWPVSGAPQVTVETGSEARPVATPGLCAEPAAALAAAYPATHPIDALNHLAALLDPSSGDLQLILVLDAIPDSRCDLAGLPSLLETLRPRNIRLHFLATNRATKRLASAFQQLSLDTGGFQILCPKNADLTSTLQALIASTFGHHRLRCTLPEPVEQIEIELQADGHQGKLMIPVGDTSPSPRMAA